MARRTRHTIAAVVALVAGLTGAVMVPALAAGPGAPAERGTQAPVEQRELRHERFASALAEELGLPVGEVEEALAAVRDQLAETREQVRAEHRADREARQAERQTERAEHRADREARHAERDGLGPHGPAHRHAEQRGATTS